MSWLRKPSLWITLASLGFMAVALHQQSGQLMDQSLDGRGWAWLLLGMGLTWAWCRGLSSCHGTMIISHSYFQSNTHIMPMILHLHHLIYFSQCNYFFQLVAI